MLVSEPTAALRTVQVRLFNLAGAGLDPAHSWAAGEVKIRKSGGSFANTTNLPTAVTGGEDGSFEILLTLAEVDTVGTLRLQFTPAGGEFAEYVDDVVASIGTSAAEVMSVMAAYEHDTGVTLGGLWERMEAFLSGQRVVTSAGSSDHFQYLNKDGDVAYEANLNKTTGDRAASDVTGSEP